MREQLAAQPQSGSHPSSPVALLLVLPIFGRAAVPARAISFADCSPSLPSRPCRCGAPPSSGLPVPPPASLYLIFQQIGLKRGIHMAFMSATLTDVTSNARIKLYPSCDVLQVANSPIFRMSGWEPRKRAYDVPPKGEGKNPERCRGQPHSCKKQSARHRPLQSLHAFFHLDAEPR